MEKNDYMVTAQNKYLVDLRAIISDAYADGIHDNDRAMQYFAKKKIEEREDNAPLQVRDNTYSPPQRNHQHVPNPHDARQRT